MMIEFNLARQVLGVKHKLLTIKTTTIMKYFNRERCINNILKHDCLNFTRHFLEGFTDEDLRECELEVVYGWI